jgi:hypothetical protein
LPGKIVARRAAIGHDWSAILPVEPLQESPAMNLPACSRLLALTAAISLSCSPFAAFAQDSATAQPLVIEAAKYDTLQAAFDAVPDSGGIVRLAPGTVEISQPLVIATPETRIEGAGAATHIKNVNQDGQPALVLRSKDRETNKKARIWRVQLGNFRISGNEKSGDGIRAEGIDEIFVQGVSIDHHGGHGLNLIDCYEDPRICDSIITYNKQAGLQIQACHDIVVSANQFEENQDAVVCVDSFNLCMNGNNLDDPLGNGVVLENTYGSVVAGNLIEECSGMAIILDRDCYGVTLSANVIAHEMSGGIDLRDAHGCAISANTFTLVHKFGVRVGPDSGRLTITGNNFSNSHIGDGKEKRKLADSNPESIDIGHGIYLEAAKQIAVSGNSFSGLDGPALSATGACDKILVSGNVVTDLHRHPQAGADTKSAFEISAESKVTLKDNLMD